MKKAIIGTVAGISIAAAGGVTTLFSSSHREAPAIAEDQFADNTDVYTFISPTDPDRLVIVANYVPLLLGSSGPNFYKFSDEVRYDIHVDNDGDAKDDLIYRYTFDHQIKNGNTFLYNTGPVDSITSANLNVTQTYRLDRIDLKTNQRTNILKNAPVAPWNVGKRSFSNYEQ